VSDAGRLENAGMDRPGWDEYFLGIAEAVALRGDCRRDRVGAVVTNWENRVVSTGYNGTLPGVKGCLEGECPRGMMDYVLCAPGGDYSNCISVHAEINALEWLDSGEGLQFPEGLTLYVTREPCSGCDEKIQFYGISRVVF
jgi:dCMP deaminase